MNNPQRALVVVVAAGVLGWILWPRRGMGGQGVQGAPAGSLANDPYTQSLLMQDINSSARYSIGGASVPLTIDIIGDCKDNGLC